MAAAGSLALRRLTVADLPLVVRWRNQPHVARWFHGSLSAAEVSAKYLPRIRGDRGDRVAVIEVDGAPIGLIRRFVIGEVVTPLGLDPRAPCLSVLIGEPGSVGQGYGTRAVAEVATRVLEGSAIPYCLIDPNVANAAAIRSYAKAGFGPVGEVDDPRGAGRLLVMRRPRREPPPHRL